MNAFSYEAMKDNPKFKAFCVKCQAAIEKDKRAFYNKQTRQVLCEAEQCGQRTARERWNQAA